MCGFSIELQLQTVWLRCLIVNPPRPLTSGMLMHQVVQILSDFINSAFRNMLLNIKPENSPALSVYCCLDWMSQKFRGLTNSGKAQDDTSRKMKRERAVCFLLFVTSHRVHSDLNQTFSSLGRAKAQLDQQRPKRTAEIKTCGASPAENAAEERDHAGETSAHARKGQGAKSSANTARGRTSTSTRISGHSERPQTRERMIGSQCQCPQG